MDNSPETRVSPLIVRGTRVRARTMCMHATGHAHHGNKAWRCSVQTWAGLRIDWEGNCGPGQGLSPPEPKPWPAVPLHLKSLLQPVQCMPMTGLVSGKSCLHHEHASRCHIRISDESLVIVPLDEGLAVVCFSKKNPGRRASS